MRQQLAGRFEDRGGLRIIVVSIMIIAASGGASSNTTGHTRADHGGAQVVTEEAFTAGLPTDLGLECRQ